MATASNMFIPPAVQPTAGTLEQAFKQYQSIADPAVAAISKESEDKINKIMNIRQMTPETAGNLLSGDGYLAAATGFNSPSDLRGLTLDEYNSIKPRETPTQIFQRHLNLADTVSGTSERRKALLGAAEREQAGRLNATQGALQFGGNQQHSRDQQTFSGESAVRQNQFQADQQARQISSHEKIAAAQNAIAREKMALEERRLTYLKNGGAGGVNADGSGKYGTTPDPTSMGKFDVELKQFGAISKDGTKFDLSNVPDHNKKSAITAYMRKEAASGLPYNQIYNLDPLHAKHFGGFTQMILGKDGWHGIYTKDGKQYVTPVPAIPYKQTIKPKASSGGGYGGTPEGYPVYGE